MAGIHSPNNLVYYDYVVDAAGWGDYTTMAGLVSAGDNKSIYVRRGTYTAGATVAVQAGQQIYFDHVIIDFGAAAYYLSLAENGAQISGHLTLQNGGWAGRDLLDISGSDNDLSGCLITIVTNGAVATSEGGFVVFGGSRNRIKVFFPTSSVNFNFPSYLVYSTASNGSVDLQVQSFTQATANAVTGYHGASGSYNRVSVDIQNITTTAGNLGYGLVTIAGCNYSTYFGTIRGQDATAVTDGGTGNKTAAVAT